MNIPIKTIEKASGIIAAERPVRVEFLTSEYVDLGSFKDTTAVDALKSSSYRFEQALCWYNVFVNRNDSALNEIKINTKWEGVISYYDSWRGLWVPYHVEGVSTGRFERDLLDAIKTRIVSP